MVSIVQLFMLQLLSICRITLEKISFVTTFLRLFCLLDIKLTTFEYFAHSEMRHRLNAYERYTFFYFLGFSFHSFEFLHFICGKYNCATNGQQHINKLNCELCDMRFTWWSQIAYLWWMRKTIKMHGMKKKGMCKISWNAFRRERCCLSAMRLYSFSVFITIERYASKRKHSYRCNDWK